jgi:hypothetical protein
MTALSNVVICKLRAISTAFFKSLRHHLMELVVGCKEALMKTNYFAAYFISFLINETLDSNMVTLGRRCDVSCSEQVVNVIAVDHVNTTT